eukprot:GHVU01182945.1.p1 GENE.GHVU01182945.1~~GHVU01182945.1.p1  ORF type:complete len:174 (+),score=36.34 GHVU01182945.1:73-594(+)
MVAITKYLLLATTVTALAVPRSVASIEADITSIDNNVKQLTTDANAYTSGIGEALTVQTDEQSLDKAINQGTTDAGNTAQASSADTQSVETQVRNLIPDIQAALTAIKNKKANFAADGLTSVVQGDLNTLKSDTDKFGAALVKIASADQTSTAQGLVSQIDADFTDAINYYAS